MMPAHRPGGSRPWRDLLDLVATVLVIAVAVTFLFNMRRTDVAAARPAGRPVPPRATDGPIEGIRVSLAGASTIGRASAPAVLIVYSDFQCPSCARFALETMPRLVKEYVSTRRVANRVPSLASRGYPPLRCEGRGIRGVRRTAGEVLGIPRSGLRGTEAIVRRATSRLDQACRNGRRPPAGLSEGVRTQSAPTRGGRRKGAIRISNPQSLRRAPANGWLRQARTAAVRRGLFRTGEAPPDTFAPQRTIDSRLEVKRVTVS